MMRRGLLRIGGRRPFLKRYYGAKRMVGDKFEYLEVVENLKVERIDMSTGAGTCSYDNGETIRVRGVRAGYFFTKYFIRARTHRYRMSSKVKWCPLECIEKKMVSLMQIL